MNLNVGCSGFFYKDWKGVFYPENLKMSDWFSYYTSFFNTVEINSTFYHFPKESNLKRWYKSSPKDFLFSVKVNRYITHIKRFSEVESQLETFYETVNKSLKEKLACFLFQLPASFVYSKENLEKILKSVKSDFCNVVEFRHKSWWNSEVFEAFKEKNIVFCSVSAPSLPEDIVNTDSTLYIRFHGKKEWYRYDYTEDELRKWVKKINQFKSKRLFVYFNNTYSGFAVKNALLFKKLMRPIQEQML